jgi:hypothetical protein
MALNYFFPYRILPIIGIWSCNALNPNQETIRIGGIPMKYPAISGVLQDSTQAHAFHKRGVYFFNDSVNLDSAQFYYENAYRIRYKLAPKHWTTGKTLLNLGNLFCKKRDFVHAQIYLEHALQTDTASIRILFYQR